MVNCAGCGRYVGDYSAYRLDAPGKPSLPLCYRCKRWADRNPGNMSFPPARGTSPATGRRLSSFSKVYIISSFGVFALGVTIALMTGRAVFGVIMILGAVSLFFFGMSMRKLSEK
jgi:hypothetical protein